VPRFGMRKFPHALAALTAILLAIAGCLAAAVVPARAASDFSLVILPDQGENAIYNFVNSATSSVNVTIYELNDTTLVNDLVAREKAGVDVRVILDQAEKSYNTAAYNALTARRRSPSMTTSPTSAPATSTRPTTPRPVTTGCSIPTPTT
jgi:predicted component of type VI protein secretion system